MIGIHAPASGGLPLYLETVHAGNGEIDVTFRASSPRRWPKDPLPRPRRTIILWYEHSEEQTPALGSGAVGICVHVRCARSRRLMLTTHTGTSLGSRHRRHA